MSYEAGHEILHTYAWLAAYVGWIHLLAGLAMAVGGYLADGEAADTTGELPDHSPTMMKLLASVPGIFVACIGLVLISWTLGSG